MVADGEVPPELAARLRPEDVAGMLGNVRRAGRLAPPPASHAKAARSPRRRKFAAPPAGLMQLTHNQWSVTDSERLIRGREGDIIGSGKKRVDVGVYARANEAAAEENGQALEIYETYVVTNRDKVVLALGCGTTEPAIAREFGLSNVTFVDPFLSGADRARFPEVLPLDRNDLAALPDGSYDVAVSCLSMFSQNKERSVAEMHRKLRPGGYAVIREPKGRNWVKKLGGVLEAAGFSVEERTVAGTGFREFVATKK